MKKRKRKCQPKDDPTDGTKDDTKDGTNNDTKDEPRAKKPKTGPEDDTIIIHRSMADLNKLMSEACNDGDIERVQKMIEMGADDFNRGLVSACGNGANFDCAK